MPSLSGFRYGITSNSLHAIFGGGKVADVVLWKSLSSGFYLAGMVVTWLIFNFFNYTFVTLLCHMSMLAMLVLFAWSNGARQLNWIPPNANYMTVPESAMRWIFSNLNMMLLTFHDISSGRDLKHFSMVFVSLLVSSFIGQYIAFLNLITCVVVGLLTGPVIYELWTNLKKDE